MLLMQHQYLFLSVVQNTLTIDSLSMYLFIKNGMQSDASRQYFSSLPEKNATSLGGIGSGLEMNLVYAASCSSSALMSLTTL